MGEVIAFRSNRPPARRVVKPNVAGRPGYAERPGRPPAGSAAPGSAADPHPEPLWRKVAGGVLRDERRRQHRTLAQVAGRAGMSVQYLSELERGRKEASSEMLSAACGSLGLSLAEFAGRCARAITSGSARPSGPLLLAA